MSLRRRHPDTGAVTGRALMARKFARRGWGTGHGPRGPLFRLRAYLCKMRGHPARPGSPGPWDGLWSFAGSFLGIFILARLDAMLFTGDQIMLLGSFGASGLIIFSAPHSEYAQPRSVIGGQILSACAGVACYALVGDNPPLAAPLSVSMAFAVMRATGAMHPPGGATALIAGSGQHIALKTGVLYPLLPVGAGVTLLFLVGVLINNLSRDRQYPLRWL